jgi:ABC-type nickel/cobalt efflux system permease component RcnA
MMDKKLFDGWLWEILLFATACAGVFALLCMAIGTAIFVVLYLLEEVKNYKRWRK